MVLRNLSGLERVWLAANGLAPPFACMAVLEGDTADVDVEDLRSAVRRAGEVTPGLRMKVLGELWWSRWHPVDDPLPVYVVDGSGWDGRSPEGADFLDRPLSEDGPVADVILATGGGEQPDRIVFRALHAVTDGRGMWAFVQDVARVMQGGDPFGAIAGPRTDADAAAELTRRRAEDRTARYLAPTGAADGGLGKRTWRRRTLTPFGDKVLPRTVVALGYAVGDIAGAGQVAVDIPVDLRSRTGAFTTANHTGWVRVDVSRALGSHRPAEAVAEAIATQVAAGDAGIPVLGAQDLRRLPLWLLRFLGRRAAERQWRQGLHPVSATVSNLGRIDRSAVSWPGFTCRSAYWVPPPSFGLPLLMILCGHEEGIELTASAPEAFATGGRLDALLDGIVAHLPAQPSSHQAGPGGGVGPPGGLPAPRVELGPLPQAQALDEKPGGDGEG